jgi:hypothetical protein
VPRAIRATNPAQHPSPLKEVAWKAATSPSLNASTVADGVVVPMPTFPDGSIVTRVCCAFVPVAVVSK